MSELAPWPKSLEAWEPELRMFVRELVGQLAPLTERIANLLGPLRVQNEERSDDPNGYSGLSQRGPYERLLASEWALQLEQPDEFIRRATSGEHLFVELERRASKVALEAWVLLDTGPLQLGSPRIGQLAALAAFARRAREAGVALRWAPLWNFELPPHEALTQASVHAWMTGRTAYVPTEGIVARWAEHWLADGARREVFLVGAPSLVPFAARHGWGSLVIEESNRDEARSLELRLTAPGKTRAKTLQLALPDERVQVRLLRDPFGWGQPHAVQQKSRDPGVSIPLVPTTDLAFSHDGHRLLARTESGSVVAMPVRNTARAGYGWPHVAKLPAGTRLVSVVWGSRRAKAVTYAWSDETIHTADWDGHTGVRLPIRSTAPLAHQLWLSPWPPTLGWERTGEWVDAKGTRRTESTLFATRVFNEFVVGLGLGSESRVLQEAFTRQLIVTENPQSALAGWSPRLGVLAMCTYVGRVELCAGHQAVRVRTLPAAVFEGTRPFGICATLWPSKEHDGVTVLAIGPDGRTLRSLDTGNTAPQWVTEIRARNPIVTAVQSAHGEYLAWRDASGEIGIHSRTRKETVLRVHVNDAGREVA